MNIQPIVKAQVDGLLATQRQLTYGFRDKSSLPRMLDRGVIDEAQYSALKYLNDGTLEEAFKALAAERARSLPPDPAAKR